MWCRQLQQHTQSTEIHKSDTRISGARLGGPPDSRASVHNSDCTLVPALSLPNTNSPRKRRRLVASEASGGTNLDRPTPLPIEEELLSSVHEQDTQSKRATVTPTARAPQVVHIGTRAANDFFVSWARRGLWAIHCPQEAGRGRVASRVSGVTGFAVATTEATTFVSLVPPQQPQMDAHSRAAWKTWCNETAKQIRLIRRIMTSPGSVKIVFDALNQMRILRKVGLTLKCRVRDPAAALWLLDCREYVKLEPKPMWRPSVLQMATHLGIPLAVSGESAYAWAMAAAKMMLTAEASLRTRMEGEALSDGGNFSTLRQWYVHVEMPATETLADMALPGLLINHSRLVHYIKVVGSVLREIRTRLHSRLGWKPDLKKTKDVRRVAVQIGALGLKDTKFSSLLAANLTNKREGRTILDLVIAHRQFYSAISKLRRFLDSVEVEVKKSSSHSSWSQCVNVPTFINMRSRNGRIFVCGGPAAFPKRLTVPSCLREDIAETSIETRSIVEADRGCLIVCADFEKFEACIAAVLARDTALSEALGDKNDFFTVLAEKLYPKVTCVTSLIRETVKRVFYGIINGMGPTRISRDAEISYEEAVLFHQRLRALFPKSFSWLESSAAQAKISHSIELASGRRRHFVPSDKDNGYKAGLLQGSGADIIKVVLTAIQPVLEALSRRVGTVRETDPKVLLVMHDEIVFQVAKTDLDAINWLRKTMEEGARGAHTAAVPFKVRVLAGTTWGAVARIPDEVLAHRSTWMDYVDAHLSLHK